MTNHHRFSLRSVLPLAIGAFAFACGSPPDPSAPDGGSSTYDDAAAETPDAGVALDASTPTDAYVPTDAPAATVDLDELPARVAQSVCDAYRGCDLPDAFVEARCTDLEHTLQAGLEPALAHAVDEGRARLDGAALEACLARLGEDTWCSSRWTSPLDWLGECRDLVVGTVPDGDACGFDWECEPADYCAIETAECGGTCVPRLAEGEYCDDVQAACADGLECRGWCEEPLVPNVTPTVVGEGERCDLTSNGLTVCAEGLFCARTEAGSGRCRGPLADDEPCVHAYPDLCGPGRYCDDSFGGSSACLELPGEGESCLFGPPGALRCAAGLGCDGHGTCVPKGELGATCFLDSECWSGACVAGECAVPTCVSR